MLPIEIALPGYELLEVLGAGASGTVYRAVQLELGREVAVKVLVAGLFDEAETEARFLRETRILARLADPHVLALYDAGVHEGRPYMVTELVRGGTLRELIDRRGGVGSRQAATIGAGIAAGLSHAHAAGVVHRDLKPDNVLMTEAGHPKVADFGLAKAIAAAQTFQSAHGLILGTPGYIAPETIQGRQAEAPADVYALGVLLCELAAGRTPFAASELSGLLREQVAGAAGAARKAQALLTGPLGQLAARCLAPEPQDRPRMKDAAEALARLSTVETAPAAPTIVTRPVKPVTRARLLAVPAFAAAVLAALMLAFAARPRPVEPPPRAAAPRPAFPSELLRMVTASPDKLKIALLGPAPAGTRLTLSAPPSSISSIQIPEGSSEFSVGGTWPATLHSGELAWPGGREPVSFAVPRRFTRSEGIVLERTKEGITDLTLFAKDEWVALSWLRWPSPDARVAVTAVSPDGGKTWRLPGHELTEADRYADRAWAGWGSRGLVVSAARLIPGKWPDGMYSSLQGFDAGRGRWGPRRAVPGPTYPSPALVTAGGQVHALYLGVSGTGRARVSTDGASLAGEERVLPGPDVSGTLHASAAGGRMVLISAALGSPPVTGPKLALGGAAPGSAWTPWRPFLDTKESLRSLDVAGMNGQFAIAYTTANDIVRTRRVDAASGAVSAAVDAGMALGERPLAPVAAVTAWRGRFYLVFPKMRPAAFFDGPEALAILSSADGEKWEPHARVQLRISGTPGSIAIVGCGSSLVVAVASRDDGLLVFSVAAR